MHDKGFFRNGSGRYRITRGQAFVSFLRIYVLLSVAVTPCDTVSCTFCWFPCLGGKKQPDANSYLNNNPPCRMSWPQKLYCFPFIAPCTAIARCLCFALLHIGHVIPSSGSNVLVVSNLTYKGPMQLQISSDIMISQQLRLLFLLVPWSSIFQHHHTHFNPL